MSYTSSNAVPGVERLEQSRKTLRLFHYCESKDGGFLSLPLAQVHVQEGADEEERDTDPRQHETVAKVAFPQISGII